MKKTKIIYSLLLASLFATSVSCTAKTPSNNPPVDGGGDKNALVNDIKYDEEGNPIFDGVELDFWSISIGSDGMIQQRIVDKFNKEHLGEISVARREVRHDEFSNTVVNTINVDPKHAPDLVVGHGPRVAELKSYNIFNKWDEAIKYSKIDFNRDHYQKAVMDDFYYDDGLYGIPLDCHSNILIYRKDIILQNGLAIPSNFDEMVEVCKQLAQKAKAGTYQFRTSASFSAGDISWQTKPAGTNLYPYYMCIEALDDEATYALTGVLQNGGKIVNEKGLPAFNTPEVINYFKRMRTLMYPTDGTLPIISETNPTEFIDQFYKGELVFASTGPWNLNGIKDTCNSKIGFGQDSFKDTVGVLPLSNMFAFDTTKEYAKTICGIAHAFSLSKTCTSATEAAAAAVFVDWMTKQYTEWLKGGHLPSLVSGMEDQEFLNSDFYQSIGQYLGNPANITLGGRTKYYTETFGSETNNGINEIWHQTFNTNTQNKTIEEIVEEQYKRSLALIADVQ